MEEKVTNAWSDIWRFFSSFGVILRQYYHSNKHWISVSETSKFAKLKKENNSNKICQTLDGTSDFFLTLAPVFSPSFRSFLKFSFDH